MRGLEGLAPVTGWAHGKARANLAMNPRLPVEHTGWLGADVFEALRVFHREEHRFDLIVLDPPKFTLTQAHAVRAYQDINLFAFRLLEPGGLLMTHSCSGGTGLDLFKKIVDAVDAGRSARTLHRLTAYPDHPLALEFPEGEYLKELSIQVD